MLDLVKTQIDGFLMANLLMYFSDQSKVVVLVHISAMFIQMIVYMLQLV